MDLFGVQWCVAVALCYSMILLLRLFHGMQGAMTMNKTWTASKPKLFVVAVARWMRISGSDVTTLFLSSVKTSCNSSSESRFRLSLLLGLLNELRCAVHPSFALLHIAALKIVMMQVLRNFA